MLHICLDDLRLSAGQDAELAEKESVTAARTAREHFKFSGFNHPARKEETAVAPEAGTGYAVSDRTPVIGILNSILEQAVSERASDIHIEPGRSTVRIRFRVDGLLRENANLPLTVLNSLVSRLKILAGMDIAEKRLPQDGRMQQKILDRDFDIRVSSLPTLCGEKVVLRLLDRSSKLLALNELGFSPMARLKFQQLIARPYGMVLVTGPTGSGKTTTLYAAVKEIYATEKNIVTIEDPVEYNLEGINQVSINVKAGLTFAAGLRSILRQDPDVIMVGEIRDVETAQIAVRAANTGHLVLCTMHTNDASSALARLTDMGVEPYLVASSVIGVVAQRLVRRICTQCRGEQQISAGSAELEHLKVRKKAGLKTFRGEGCVRCGHSGFLGRLAVAEILQVSSPVRQMVMRKQSSDALRRYLIEEEGFVTMGEDGVEKAGKGLTTLEEVAKWV